MILNRKIFLTAPPDSASVSGKPQEMKKNSSLTQLFNQFSIQLTMSVS